MENKLRQLYTLQLIDSNLDEIEEMKGDLPGEVRELEEKVEGLNVTLASLEQTMRGAFSQRDNADSEIISLKEKIEKYKSQQYQVRNNKEYDALTKEMDQAAETIARLEKEMSALENKATVARTEIEATKKELEESQALLEEKKTELAEVSKSTEEEELKFQHEREKVLVRISKTDLAMYERIRTAKNGRAVVPIKRGACGGCYTAVPPQKVLELKRNNQLYTCERCGRIIVSEEIAESSTALV
ncbi:MAG: C4-type zinc ribbon domain-containing protein [Bacteroidota bacterium]